MQHTQKCVVKGAGFFEGNVEGTDYKSGQIFIEEEFSATKPNYKGFRTVEYKCMGSDTVKPLMHNTFPLNCEVTFDTTATKRGMEILVTNIKLIDTARPMPRPAAPGATA